MDINQLLNAHNPFENESINGYIQRLALINGYENANWIYTIIGLNRRIKSSFSISKDLELLGHFTRQSVESLQRLTFFNQFTKEDNYNNFLYMYGITTHSKYCPVCFKDQRFHNKYWDLSFNLFCHKHNTLLVDYCPNCNKAISSNLQNMNQCLCGFALEDLPVIKVKEEYSFIGKLIENIFIEKGNSSENILCKLAPYEFTSLIIFLIRILYYDKYKKFSRTSTHFNRSNEYEQIILNAFNLFENWPVNFHQFLNSYGSVIRRKDRITGVTTYFGRFYLQLYSQFNDSSFDFIKEEFERYLKNNFYKVYFNRLTKVDAVDGETKYVSGMAASKILKVNHDAIAKLVSKGKIKGKVEIVGKQMFISVEYQSLMEYKQWVDAHINVKQAVSILGINRYRIIELYKKGILEGYEESRSTSVHIYISEKSISKVIQSFEDQLEYKEYKNIKLVDFQSCIHSWGCKKISVNELVQNIMSGELKPLIKGSGKGLNNYFFSKVELDEIGDKINNKENKKQYTVQEVCKLLKADYHYIKNWIDSGVLQATKINRRTVIIFNYDLDDFQQKYITLKEISNVLNENSKLLVNRIKRLGISIVCNPISNSGGYLFLREEIKKNLLIK